jgi:high-affinity iron transporter
MFSAFTRFLQEEVSNSIFNGAIATIFAREFLEGAVIIGNYRTAINKSEHWKSSDHQNQALLEVTKSAAFASLVAITIVIVVGIILAIVSKELNDKVLETIEGVSKVIAAVCILQLSLKIPTWLGLYEKVSILPCKEKVPSFANNSLEEHQESEVMTISEIRFNVAWNIWREVAECGVFLIPFFLQGNGKAVPISALVGIAVAVVLGGVSYYACQLMKSKFWVAFFMATLTGFLSIGLFVGGIHEFEEVLGESPDVYEITNEFWSSKRLPMAILVPFGYSWHRTIVQMVCFWSWLVLSVALHTLKFRASEKYRSNIVSDPEKGVIQE